MKLIDENSSVVVMPLSELFGIASGKVCSKLFAGKYFNPKEGESNLYGDSVVLFRSAYDNLDVEQVQNVLERWRKGNVSHVGITKTLWKNKEYHDWCCKLLLKIQQSGAQLLNADNAANRECELYERVVPRGDGTYWVHPCGKQCDIPPAVFAILSL